MGSTSKCAYAHRNECNCPKLGEIRKTALRNTLQVQQPYDLVLLQEMWTNNIDPFIKSEICHFGMIYEEEGVQRINAIIYQPDKLEMFQNIQDALVNKVGMESSELIKHRAPQFEQSGRLVIAIFGKKGNNCPAFMAMSLHAPSKDWEARKQLLEGVRGFANAVVAAGLPVLIGGDFNASINWWQLDKYQGTHGYQGLLYWPGRRYELIDFVTAKAPNAHCTLEDVQAAKIPIQGVPDYDLMQAMNHDPLTATFTYPV